MAVFPPYNLNTPQNWKVPLVVSAPHAGTEIPRGFILSDGTEGKEILAMSDTAIDRAAKPAATKLGFPFLASRYIRAFIDLNRDPNELDPELIDGLSTCQSRIQPGSKIASGLGLVPRLANSGTPIYSRRLSLKAVQSRIERYYRPYHDKLEQLVSSCLNQFGTCMLIDLHSMPPINPALARRYLGLTPGQPTRAQQKFPSSPVNVILGNNFGASLPDTLTEKAREFWQAQGLTVSVNHPYAGGHITTHYGKKVSTLQVEICRSLYPGLDLSPTSKRIERLFYDFATNILDTLSQMTRLAAE